MTRYVLAPLEPTPAMIEAAMTHWGGSSVDSPLTAASRAEIYRAMIAAAPSVSAEHQAAGTNSNDALRSAMADRASHSPKAGSDMSLGNKEDYVARRADDT